MRTLAELAAITCWLVRSKLRFMSFSLNDFLALTFVLAPLPNALFAHCGGDELSSNYESSAPVDLGRFITATIVVTGFALPIILAHSGIINTKACVMAIMGGG